MLDMNLYQNQGVAFLTQHGKEDLVRQPLQDRLGCRLMHTQAYDTDRLGTFTGEIARHGSQLDTAREKAKIGMALTQTRIGLASEGAFGADPFGGWMPWNTELLLWVDEERQLEIKGIAQGPAQSLSRWIETTDQLDKLASEAQFPLHHLNLRPAHEDSQYMVKGLRDKASLLQAFEQAKQASSNGLVLVENDLRAFGNPTRQGVIRNALQDLLRQLTSRCPQCASPGYWITQRIPGLPCKACAHPTQLPIAQRWRCPACHHEAEESLLTRQGADPSLCDVCNP